MPPTTRGQIGNLGQNEPLNVPNKDRIVTSVLLIYGNGQQATLKALIDSGAHCLAISSETQQRLKIPKQNKPSAYQLNTIAGDSVNGDGWIREETQPIIMNFQHHIEEIKFDIIKGIKVDVILGYPWLEYHNPSIDWKTREVTLPRCLCMKELCINIPCGNIGTANAKCEFRSTTVPRLGPIKLKPRKSAKKAKLTVRQEKQQRYIPVSMKGMKAVSKRKPQQVFRAIVKEIAVTDMADQQIPKEFASFADVFEESKNIPLPEHKPWDHAINIKDGESPKRFKPYKCSAKELEILREYIDEMLAKGYIRPSTAPAGYPVLFAPKPGTDKLRVCVDYRQLNEITIKDR